MSAPGFWMHESSGVLRPVVEAYLLGQDLDSRQVAMMRVYLRQWIDAPAWRGEEIEKLRRDVEQIRNTADIHRWLWDALAEGIDPL